MALAPSKILIVTKTTNFELHGSVIAAKVTQGRMPKEMLTRLEQAHTEHYDTLAALKAALERSGLPYEQVTRDELIDPSRFRAVVSVGGDGTLLASTHQMVTGGTIFGVRSSVSSVGFLCCAGPTEMSALVQALGKQTFQAVTVPRLKARIRRGDATDALETAPILNDFLYTNGNPAATTRYRLKFKGIEEVHRSSGLWIATGVGSTAAILAAGGERRPIEDPQAQFRVRELYRLGHTEPQLAHGFFDPDQEGPVIENRCPEAILATDGQHGTIPIGYGDVITFHRAAPLQLVKSLIN